jgi:hypothetical protein
MPEKIRFMAFRLLEADNKKPTETMLVGRFRAIGNERTQSSHLPRGRRHHESAGPGATAMRVTDMGHFIAVLADRRQLAGETLK